MKRRTYFITGILLIAAALAYIFYQGKTVNIYVGSTGENTSGGVDIILKVNSRKVWDGNISAGLMNYKKIPERFQWGYNTIEIISKNKKLTVKKEVFIQFNQHIVVEYMPVYKSIRDKATFEIWVRSGSFYYE